MRGVVIAVIATSPTPPHRPHCCPRCQRCSGWRWAKTGFALCSHCNHRWSPKTVKPSFAEAPGQCPRCLKRQSGKHGSPQLWRFIGGDAICNFCSYYFSNSCEKCKECEDKMKNIQCEVSDARHLWKWRKGQ